MKKYFFLFALIIIQGCSSGGGDSTVAGVPNTLPIANAGHDLNALINAVVVLDGGASIDADGDSLTYSWSLESVPAGSAATFSNLTSSTPNFITDASGTYTISLIVNDGHEDSAPVMVNINVISSVSHIRDTGQEKCYDNTAEIPCPNIGEDFYGQDAHYSTNPLRFVDNGSTVLDSITGLMWQKADDGLQYNWYRAMGITDTTYNPGTINVCGSLIHGGFTDWRLPSVRELVSLLNYVYDDTVSTAGIADIAYFESTGTVYWSSTLSQEGSPDYYPYAISEHTIGYTSRADIKYVRCVRGASWGQNTYTDNGDGTVTDSMSGLVWQKNEDGAVKNWNEALAYCENLSLANSIDWRLPDVKELHSLVTINASNEIASYPSASVDVNYFPTINTTINNYWSSTTFDIYAWPDKYYAWNVSLGYGAFVQSDIKSSYKLALCVK